MRNRADNCVVICSIENIDPMGVHTGDSITVAPIQTLTDREYQAMRDASFAVIREIGVETGGSNIQFAINPANGRMIVIEMNPRVSRSSALASKATEFPIAKLAVPTAERIFWIQTAFSSGFPLDEVQQLTQIDPWFLVQMQDLFRAGDRLDALDLREAKKLGFSDRQIALACGTTEENIRKERRKRGIVPGYRLVDTCAAEFEAYTPYFYSIYGDENEAREIGRKKILILGGGPNRIGPRIKFDYCCVHASVALREMGYETIIVNSNPETVSTGYDSSDKLFFEPLTLEDVLHICEQ